MLLFVDYLLRIRKGTIIPLLFVCFVLNSSAQRPKEGIQLEKEVFSVKGNSAFVILPETLDKNSPIPWVWFAPTIDICPTENDTWIFNQILENGITMDNSYSGNISKLV